MLIKRTLLSLLCLLCMTSISYAQQKLSTSGVTMGQSKSEVLAVIKNKVEKYDERYDGNETTIRVKEFTVAGARFDSAIFTFIDNKLSRVGYWQDLAFGVDHPDFYSATLDAPYASARIKADNNRDKYTELLNSLITKYGNPSTVTGSEATKKCITWHVHNGTITLRYLRKEGYHHLYSTSRTIMSELSLEYEDSSAISTDL